MNKRLGLDFFGGFIRFGFFVVDGFDDTSQKKKSNGYQRYLLISVPLRFWYFLLHCLSFVA